MDLVDGAGFPESRKETDQNSAGQADTLRQPVDAGSGLESGSSINSLIQSEIIPRLLMVHSAEGKSTRFFEGRRAKQGEVSRFAAMPLNCEAEELLAEVANLQFRGVSTESILVDLLPASARALGRMWENDSCDFVDVTVGLMRLHEVLRECVPSKTAQFDSSDPQHSALFSPLPGEKHNFGTLVVEEVFASAGWQTEVLFEPQRHELIHLLADRPFDLVGLTISCDCPSATVSDLITAIRSVSKNSKVRVIIGGPHINANPTLALGVGADGTAEDARSALALAERIVAGSQPVTSSMP